MSDTKTIKDLTRDLIEKFSLDFIIKELSAKQLVAKYNLSEYSVYEMIKRLNLVKKRDKYRTQVLDKAIDRCSTYQSKIIYKATGLIHGHIDTLEKKMKKPNAEPLTSTEVRDIMAILQIVSKEHRLDHEQPTDRAVKEVRVSFPEGFTPITHTKAPIVEAEYKEIENEKPIESEENKEEKIDVEVDNSILENPFD